MGEFRAEKRVVIAHQMEWIRDEGLKKLVKSSIWKKLTNLWPAQLWHDGHHGVLQDYPGRIDFESDTHKVCFYLSLRCAVQIQNPVFQALDLLSSSSLPLCPPSSPKITEWSKLKPPAERKCDCSMLLAQVGLGRKHILSQLVQSRPNSLTVHCNRLIVIFIMCLMVIVIMCLSLSHHPQLVVTVSISVTFYDCQCNYLFYNVCLITFGTLHMRGGQFPTSIISWNTLFKFIS